MLQVKTENLSGALSRAIPGVAASNEQIRAQQLRCNQATAEISVVAVTASVMNGFDAFERKPISALGLLQTVRRLLEASAARAPVHALRSLCRMLPLGYSKGPDGETGRHKGLKIPRP